MTANRAWLQQAARRLAEAGETEPPREARLLFAAIAGRPAALADPEAAADPELAARLDAALARRAAGETLGRILGRREFWSLDFRLDAATLEPRPDSETLVAAVLSALQPAEAACRLLDLGTGTGCLLLALLSERPAAWGLGIDLAPAAARQAAANAAHLGLDGRSAFMAGDWAAALSGEAAFDAVLSNPPYVTSAACERLPASVRGNDPRLALDGGSDGLDAYRAVLPQAWRLLRPGGWVALEIGSDQLIPVGALIDASGFRDRRVERDLAGRARVVLARRPGP